MKAVNTDRRCLYVTKDESEGKGDLGYWGKRLETGLYDRQSGKQGPQVEPPAEAALPAVGDGVDTRFILGASLTEPAGDSPVERELYNTRDDLYVEERPNQSNVRALRPAADDYTHEGAGRTPAVTWTEYVEDGETSALTASDKASGEFLRVESVDALTDSDRLRSAAPAYYYYEEQSEEYVLHVDGEEKRYQSKVEILDNWHHIKQPYVPQTEFERPVTEDDFAIVVFPNADNEQYDQPVHYRHGECTPLYEYLGLIDEAATDNSETANPTEDTATPSSACPDSPSTASPSPPNAEADATDASTPPEPEQTAQPRRLGKDPEGNSWSVPSESPVTAGTLDGLSPPGTVAQVAAAVQDHEITLHRKQAFPESGLETRRNEYDKRVWNLAHSLGAGVYRGEQLAAALAANYAADQSEEDQTAADILQSTAYPLSTESSVASSGDSESSHHTQRD